MISTNLVFLINSLPYLTFEDSIEQKKRIQSTFQKYTGRSSSLDLSLITLLEKEAEKYLSPKQFLIFQTIELSHIHQEVFRDSKVKTIATFAQLMYRFKTALHQMQKDEIPAEFPFLHQLYLMEGTPLEKEIQFMQLQWTQLEELGTDHHFDFAALIIYKLQLQILCRWWSFDEKIGFARFQAATKQLTHDR